MDTTDQEIEFYGTSGCTHCRHAKRFVSQSGGDVAKADSASHLYSYLKQGNHDSFDALVGLSGGVDSSWVLHCLHKHEVRVLAFHVDTGWNSPEAVSNIYRLCKGTGSKLITRVVDWNMMKKLQLAFFYSGVINQDIPQDMAIFSAQYAEMCKRKIGVLVTGANNRTESILPSCWGHHYHDIANAQRIYRWFWGTELAMFPYTDIDGLLDYRVFGGRLRGFNTVNIFDIIEYSKSSSQSSLEKEYCYTPYKNKHGESLWTLYYQTIYLPDVYGIDKRRAHLSNLVMNNEISRSEALERISTPMLDALEKEDLAHFVATKLGVPFAHALNPGRYIRRVAHDSYSPGSGAVLSSSWNRLLECEEVSRELENLKLEYRDTGWKPR